MQLGARNPQSDSAERCCASEKNTANKLKIFGAVKWESGCEKYTARQKLAKNIDKLCLGDGLNGNQSKQC
jgi:hypothetical protein